MKIKISKYLSYILRHNPDSIGLCLDENGWAHLDEIIKLSSSKMNLTHSKIFEVVETNDKKRFSLSSDRKRIRANQGHSIKINLELPENEPPEFLYHGTIERFLDSIFKEGLKSKNRHHVHLSSDLETAENVGKRRGKSIVLKIFSKQMYRNNIKFYLSENNVWLTETVPVKYIQKLS